MSNLSSNEAREIAIQLVKEAIGAGVTEPSAGWTGNPSVVGEKLGQFMGAAVESLAKKLQEL